MDRDVIDFDATFDQEFFGVAVREPLSEVPADSEHDDLGREPVTGEPCAIVACCLLLLMVHLFSLAG